MTDYLQWVVVSPDLGVGRSMEWSCAEVVALQAAGADPTRPWREALHAEHRASYGDVPLAAAATFVMQWYLDVVAQAATASAAVGEWLVDVSPDGLRFDLAESGCFPVAFSIRADGAQHIPDVRQRRDVARAAYTDHCLAFVETYSPGVKISSRQRRGMVTDVWEMAWHRAASRLPITAHPYRRRLSCCFAVKLPGLEACETCPQRA